MDLSDAPARIHRMKRQVNWRGLGTVCAILACWAAVAPAGAAARPEPALRLVTTSATADAIRFRPTEPAFADVPAFVVASSKAAFEVHAERRAFNLPFTVTQVVTGGGRRVRALPRDVVNQARPSGLRRFFRFTVTDSKRAVRLRTQLSFCPVDRQRFRPGSRETPVYPDACGTDFGANPFVLGQVWGIERGWGANAVSVDEPEIALPDGVYRGELTIVPRYRRLFGIPKRNATARWRLRVRTETRPCPEPDPCARRRQSVRRASSAPIRPTGHYARNPDPATLPNLAALPAWGIRTFVDRTHHRDELQFSATVWNAGPAQLSVDGFRGSGQDRMTAYQNLYRGGRRVGYRRVGSFEYDPRPGHEHWHFRDFATYRLLRPNRSLGVRSGKEAFCLAPTDPVNLAARGATWRPDELGFGDCGGRTSLSLREALPGGWGDTYEQTLPGQSFDITDLPNGTYYIQVKANPVNKLKELSTTNNTSLRKIVLGGTKTKRTLTVPPVDGIEG
jgi:hypothetical protein